MAYMPTIAGNTVAISISESPDMSVFGLSDAHLRDAMDRLALHLLSSGARLAYGGDMRKDGFTEWLFELVSRYRRETSETQIGVTSYLAWPNHISMSADELEKISNSHEDQEYKDLFVHMMGDDMVDKSVEDGDIGDLNIKTETLRQKIRDDFIADATVTIVLIGPCTWQRKHVDWEIGSSLRKTDNNPRCGLLGILLPNHPDFGTGKYHPHLIPPRLADNCGGDDPYACIYNWPGQQATDRIREWIHKAFQRKDGTSPDNSRDQFGKNH